MQYLLLATLLTPLLPAVFNFGFEQAKVIFFLATVSLLGLTWSLKNWRRTIKWTNLKTASLLLVGMLLVTSIIGADLRASFLGTEPYYQGFFLYTTLLLLSLVISNLEINLNQLIFAVGLSTLGVSAVAIFQAVQLYLFHLDVPNYAGRVVSTFGQPNLYAGFLVMSIQFLYFGIQKQKEKLRKFYIFCLLLASVGIVISASRIAIALLVGLVVLWFFNKIKRKKWLPIIYGLLIGLSIVFLFQKEFIQPQDTEWLKYNSPERRIVFWPVLIEQFSKRWLSGYGLENIDIAFDRYEKFHEERIPVYYHFKNLNIDRAHNYSLDLLLFGGILTFSAWVYLIYILYKKVRGTFLVVPLLIYLIWTQFQVQGVMQLIYFWMLVGIADSGLEY